MDSQVKSIPLGYCRREEVVHKMIVIISYKGMLQRNLLLILEIKSLKYLGDILFNVL